MSEVFRFSLISTFKIPFSFTKPMKVFSHWIYQNMYIDWIVQKKKLFINKIICYLWVLVYAIPFVWTLADYFFSYFFFFFVCFIWNNYDPRNRVHAYSKRNIVLRILFSKDSCANAYCIIIICCIIKCDVYPETREGVERWKKIKTENHFASNGRESVSSFMVNAKDMCLKCM